MMAVSIATPLSLGIFSFTSPEPVSNWTASVTEDVAVVGGLALAFSHPWIALAIVVSISLAFALLVWWAWRKLFRRAPKPQPG